MLCYYILSEAKIIVQLRLKKFKILTHIPNTLYIKASFVFQLCAALVNFQNPIFKEGNHLFITDEN